jgi:hypothetical protein
MQGSEVQMTPQQHAQRIEQMLQQARQECRDDSGRVSDPKAQALFETTAEAIGGLLKPSMTTSRAVRRSGVPECARSKPVPRLHLRSIRKEAGSKGGSC